MARFSLRHIFPLRGDNSMLNHKKNYYYELDKI